MRQAKVHSLQQDVEPQTPPVGPPSDYWYIAQAAYEHESTEDSTNNTLAQQFLYNKTYRLDMHYEVLQSRSR